MKARRNTGSPLAAGLAGARCLITGGGSGIGAGIARVLSAGGARIAVLGRRAAPLRATIAQLGDVAAVGRSKSTSEGAEKNVRNAKQRGKAASGGSGAPSAKPFAVVADVADRDGMRRAVAGVGKTFGGLDVVVANAGIGGPNVAAVPGPDRWDEIVRTNLDGVYFTTMAALPWLTDGGRIVVISSVLGRFGVPGYTAYCASKHGVIGFCKALAHELAPRRITVNAICPGWVDTDMATAGMQAMADAMQVDFEVARRQALAAVPLGRILEPDEIGGTVAWLCSPAASGMTGQAISHCGGQVMW
jgi:NAD(P)-dependent dehydrogenase (short-subunit alcohol dehydrogenase family)